MKKLLTTFLLLVAIGCSVFGFTACSCNKTPQVSEPPLPTAAEVVAARKRAADETVQGYDFNLTITGDFSVLGLGTSLSGKYDGAYRYDGNTDNVSFKRATSGALLADSTCYVFTSGDNRIKATMDGNTVKKLSVELPEEQDITMVNLPIVKIVDSFKEVDISNIKAVKNSSFAYSCNVAVSGSNPLTIALSKVFEKLGTDVSFKGITLSENTSKFDFNLKDGKLNDFHLGFKFKIAVKAVNVILSVDYTQNGNSATVSLPNTTASGIVYNKADILREVNTINTAIDDLKDDPVYSLDLTAKNEFDPGWNKTAIVDSYTARMYKKTVDGVAWFNHSYYYKAHSETAGKETYKYTLGNVNGKDADNQGTWLISRKGGNTSTKVENVTADTQFDFLTSMVKQQANEIDCIKKQVSGTTTTFTVYLGKLATKSVQQKIIDMINTNEYNDVIAVNNYFNTENIVNEASIKIVITDGKISAVTCNTELKYNPIGGEWTEYNITLNNTIELQVNKNLKNAQDYILPTKVEGKFGVGKNLNDSEFYIL